MMYRGSSNRWKWMIYWCNNRIVAYTLKWQSILNKPGVKLIVVLFNLFHSILFYVFNTVRMVIYVVSFILDGHLVIYVSFNPFFQW